MVALQGDSMTSSHDNKKFRTRSMEKLRGMAFGFRKTATAVKKPDRFIYLFIHQLVSKMVALQGASM